MAKIILNSEDITPFFHADVDHGEALGELFNIVAVAPRTIFVLAIDTPSGNLISVHTSREAAEDELFQYVKASWDYYAEDLGVMPERQSHAIEDYFDTDVQCDDFYAIHELEIE